MKKLSTFLPLIGIIIIGLVGFLLVMLKNQNPNIVEEGNTITFADKSNCENMPGEAECIYSEEKRSRDWQCKTGRTNGGVVNGQAILARTQSYKIFSTHSLQKYSTLSSRSNLQNRQQHFLQGNLLGILFSKNIHITH